MRLVFKFRNKIKRKLSLKQFVKADVGDVMALLSLCTFAIVGVEFIAVTNFTAVVSTFPLWIVAIILATPAVLSWVIFNSKLGLLASIIWFIFLMISNDHLPALSRMGQAPPAVSETDTDHGLGVVSFNCYTIKELNAEPFKKLGARIVLLQEIRPFHDIDRFARELFGEHAKIIRKADSAIITQGGSSLQIESSGDESTKSTIQIASWEPFENLPSIRIVNVSLEYVDPFRNIFKPSSWKYYSDMRHLHQKQIVSIIDAITENEAIHGEYPLLTGGSFSVQATSPVFKPFAQKLNDGYLVASTSYGATFPADFPIFRFDRIFCSSLIKFNEYKTVYVRGSQRRAVYSRIYPSLR